MRLLPWRDFEVRAGRCITATYIGQSCLWGSIECQEPHCHCVRRIPSTSRSLLVWECSLCTHNCCDSRFSSLRLDLTISSWHGFLSLQMMVILSHTPWHSHSERKCWEHSGSGHFWTILKHLDRSVGLPCTIAKMAMWINLSNQTQTYTSDFVPMQLMITNRNAGLISKFFPLVLCFLGCGWSVPCRLAILVHREVDRPCWFIG